MHCSLFVSAIIATWDAEAGAVKILLRKTAEKPEIPEVIFTSPGVSPSVFVDELIQRVVTDATRIHYANLPLATEGDKHNMKVIAPFLVLCPSDVIRTGDFELVSLEESIANSATDKVLAEVLKVGLIKLRELIGTSTACLHMLPTFFSNVEIKRIHNAVLGGEVNRMTLRKRFEEFGHIAPTGDKFAVKKGRQPQEMMHMTDSLHVFGNMITVLSTTENAG